MRNCTKTLLAAGAIAAAGTLLAGPAFASGGKAMTWRVHDFSEATDPARVAAWDALPKKVVVVGCASGTPNCDAYKGDLDITQKRRIMCFVPGNSPEPAGYPALLATLTPGPSAASQNPRFYFGWSGGEVGLSEPYTGNQITSRATGDKMCQTDLRDPRARMIEHHDNKVGGWNLGGMLHPRSKAKKLLVGSDCECQEGRPRQFWAAINGQPANPWDN